MAAKFFILLLSILCLVSGNSDYEDNDYYAGSSDESTIKTMSTTTERDRAHILDNNINWRDGDEGQVQWANSCDFDGKKIGHKLIRSEDCGSACLARADCVTFSWTYAGGGTCYFKDGGLESYTSDTAVCGRVIKRKTKPSIEKSSDDDYDIDYDDDRNKVKTTPPTRVPELFDDENDDDIKWLAKCAYPPHTKGITKTFSGLGPVGVLYDLALAAADRIIAGLEKFTTCPAANECKFNITHYGKGGKNGFRSEWVAVDGTVNSNNEQLNGLGHQVDSGLEKIDGRLSSIKFDTYGQPCIKAITIACGEAVVPGNAYIKITHKQMVAARVGQSRHIETDTIHDCVDFSEHYAGNYLNEMHIRPDLFNCRTNDLDCIRSHLNIV